MKVIDGQTGTSSKASIAGLSSEQGEVRGAQKILVEAEAERFIAELELVLAVGPAHHVLALIIAISKIGGRASSQDEETIDADGHDAGRRILRAIDTAERDRVVFGLAGIGAVPGDGGDCAGL
jgi:hypothetical protein